MKSPYQSNYRRVFVNRGVIAPVVVSFMLSALVAQGATLTWDAGSGAVAGAQDGAGNWNGVVTNWWDGTTNVAATTAVDNLTIGNNNGAAGTITVAGTVGVPLLANNITFNAATSGEYVLDGGAIQLAVTGTVTVNENVTISNSLMLRNFVNLVVATGKTLTLNSSATNTTTNTTFGQTLTGGGTVKLTAGTFVSGNGPSVKNGSTTAGGLEIAGTATFTSGAGMQLGQTTNGLIKLKDSGNYIMTSTGQMSVGRTAGSGRLIMEGGTFSETTSNTTQASILVARQNATGVIDITGGRFEILGNGGVNALTTNTGGVVVVNAQATTGTSSGTINISGGVAKIKELRFNGGNLHTDAASTAGSGTLNLSGGSLYIGGLVKSFGASPADVAGGIVNVGTGTSSYAINLSGGTLGANADWSSSLNMNLTNTNGGVTFKAADESNASKNITLSGILSGAGGLTKSGLGTLTLSGTGNAFTGNIVVQAGTLSLASAFVNDAASIYLTTGSLLNLNYSGTDSISKLFIDGVQQDAGLYDSSNLSSLISGAGVLQVTSAIPEPSSYGLVLSGLLMVGVVARHRRSREAKVT